VPAGFDAIASVSGARPVRVVVIALFVAGLATACSGSTQPATDSDGVRVTERDFHISAPQVVAAGNVVISAHNTGPDAHELILIRRTRPGLPLRPDGVTVDEDAIEAQTVGAIEPYEPGTTEDLRVHLAPGRYVFICNMSGHYLGGMHADIVVR
jgi:uncharacterized cupredoxin-like copper-binding protein